MEMGTSQQQREYPRKYPGNADVDEGGMSFNAFGQQKRSHEDGKEKGVGNEVEINPKIEKERRSPAHIILVGP